MENMRRCVARWVEPMVASMTRPCRVLDVGGVDVNGSYRDLLDDRFEYVAADLHEAPGVGLVLEDPYHIPVEDGAFDVVMSGQMLEHCEYFWLQFREMVRVTAPDGYLIVIAPSEGQIHRYPVDCYRYYPDAYHALARDAGVTLAEVHRDPRGPWYDLVGVFHHPSVRERRPATAPVDVGPALPAVDPGGWDAPAEQEVHAGSIDYLDVMATLHRDLAPRNYLEIGVRHGGSLRLATCPAVGVDPAPEITVELPPTTQVVASTSDDWFARGAPELEGPVDLAMVDGLHLAEFALRDVMHVEERMHPTGVIVIDDVLPNHPAQARRERVTRTWTGDVWKVLEVLRSTRPDLVVLPLDTAPVGIAVVAALDPSSRALWDLYNPIVRDLQREKDPPSAVLERRGVHRDLASLRMLLLLLRSLREQDASVDEVGRRVRDLLSVTTGGTADA